MNPSGKDVNVDLQDKKENIKFFRHGQFLRKEFSTQLALSLEMMTALLKGYGFIN